MPNFGFVIDNRKCIGCHACTVACKSEHQVPLGVDRTWVKYVEKGTFPNNRRLFTVMRCNHCEWAPCVTICPVTALYRRDDGVVDFNPDRCIGCKGCLQACPYDALYIDPETHTAAKCNFCSHRLEIGLEPSCVVVCPEQAIIAGDLNDPNSNISQLIARHPVQVRKPEKGTKPKLFYIEGDQAALVPERTATDGRTMWNAGEERGAKSVERDAENALRSTLDASRSTRRVYDVRPRPPAWGWQVSAYTWTKSIAAGAFLAVCVDRLLGGWMSAGVAVAMGIVALLALAATAALLVADLKQPKRFLYVLLRPQWRSWLVRGAYALTAYGGLLTLWIFAMLFGANRFAEWLMVPAALLAILSAVYTAFLFAQAKGRDFWQNPLLSVHLLVHAMLAGGTVWLIVGSLADVDPTSAWLLTMISLGLSLLTLFAEHFTTPPTEDARRALEMIVRRPYGLWFWIGGIFVGHALPLLLLVATSSMVPAAILILAGMLVIEHLWVLAPQKIALS